MFAKLNKIGELTKILSVIKHSLYVCKIKQNRRVDQDFKC